MIREARSSLRRYVWKKRSFAFFELLFRRCGGTGAFLQSPKTIAIPWSSDGINNWALTGNIRGVKMRL
jgi:hypothetical protein